MIHQHFYCFANLAEKIFPAVLCILFERIYAQNVRIFFLFSSTFCIICCFYEIDHVICTNLEHFCILLNLKKMVRARHGNIPFQGVKLPTSVLHHIHLQCVHLQLKETLSKSQIRTLFHNCYFLKQQNRCVDIGVNRAELIAWN